MLKALNTTVFLFVLMGTSLSVQAQGVPVTLQWFESSWRTMEDRTADAFMAGYARVWTPPPGKGASGGYSIGYDCFDRFDLGSPGNPTHYGTRAGLAAVIAEQDQAGIGTFVDLILNHNAFSDNNTPGFAASGDYPGFVLSYGGDGDGDFHARWDDCDADPLNCRIAGLIDIAHEKNHVMIRHPVTPGDPQNIPAGSVYDQPVATNRQFYPDQDLAADSIGIRPFNTLDPMAGDPVAENATGLLLRNIRWLLEVVKVDGFRIDAAKHMPAWVLRDFYDRHVWLRGQPDLAGNPTTPYSFVEDFDGDLGAIANYVCKNGAGNCNPADGVSGNRDALDFPLYFKLHDELNGTGLGSWENIITASVDGMIDGNPNNGTFGVQYVGSHDQFAPVADNLAYAYVLMRTGSPIVYFRADEFGNPDFPKPGRGDALGGQFGTLLTTLVDIHNEYARGTYLERRDAGNPSFEDVLIFERDNACLVGLNDRMDGGYDQRTIVTNFAAGTRLQELTGNATDATVDPFDDIYDVATVGAGGVVTIRVPRNRNPNGTLHHRGYVIYGPFNPVGALSLTNVADTLPADPPSVPNGTRRLTPLESITADSFEVRLETTDADPLGDGEDDHAMLRLDAGRDVNGNGHIDALDPAFVGYGYEDFVTQHTSLQSGGVVIDGVTKGLYRQTIDTTGLADGRHYLSVIAFRSRPAGTPPIFQTWRKVILLDRVPPVVQLAAPGVDERINTATYTFTVLNPDRTANSVHLFLDAAPGTDLVALAQQGQGQATQTDRGRFELGLTGLTKGLHRLDVVAFEATGRVGQTTFDHLRVALNGYDLPDWDGDGDVDQEDFGRFQVCLSGAGVPQTDPACAPALLTNDTDVDSTDLVIFLQCFTGPNQPADPSCLSAP